MSWNKNTRVMSSLNAVKEAMDELGFPYELTVLGKVMGIGLNDNLCGDDVYYEMRRLEYRDLVILEQLIRHYDCDVDDLVVSEKFSLEQEPKDWQILTKIKEEEE